ncbi:unnamed protein product [Prunus brigantina]
MARGGYYSIFCWSSGSDRLRASPSKWDPHYPGQPLLLERAFGLPPPP